MDTTHLSVSPHPPPHRSQEEPNSEDSEEENKKRTRAGAALAPEVRPVFRRTHRAPTSDPARPKAAVAGYLRLNAPGRENKCAPPSWTSASRPHPAQAARTPPPPHGRSRGPTGESGARATALRDPGRRSTPPRVARGPPPLPHQPGGGSPRTSPARSSRSPVSTASVVVRCRRAFWGLES